MRIAERVCRVPSGRSNVALSSAESKFSIFMRLVSGYVTVDSWVVAWNPQRIDSTQDEYRMNIYSLVS
jgi:hypothetical protein